MVAKDFETFTITLDDGTVETYGICTYLPDSPTPAEIIVEEKEDDKEKEVTHE